MYGALLGMQEGRDIEICNSFELLVVTVEGKVVHDDDYFTAKEKQCKSKILSRCAKHHVTIGTVYRD